MIIVKSEKLLNTLSKLVWLSKIHNNPIVRQAHSARSQCSKKQGPRCSAENLQKTACNEQTKKNEKKKEDNILQSMTYNPQCCTQVCVNVLPRLDDLYYKISDKASRVYNQTWVECPEFKIEPKPVCHLDQLKYPPLIKRQYKKGMAKCPEGNDKEQLACHLEKNKNCNKVRAPGCRSSRDPPICNKVRKRNSCEKVCTPYPSFSECLKPKLGRIRPAECDCMSTVALCELCQYMRKQSNLGVNKKLKKL